MEDPREEEEEEGMGSWLDELSPATRLVVFLIVGTIGLYFLFVIVEQLL